MKVLEVAALLGAQILEKHFSHDKTLPGNDHYHAMDYKDLQLFRQNFERTVDMMMGFLKSHMNSMKGRPRRHRGRYRPPVGASGIRNACAGRGWRRSPFLRPIRCGSPLSPEFRTEEGNGERTVNGKTIIEHSVRCVSIFLKSGAIRRFPRRETGKRAHLAGRQGWGPEGGEKQSQGNLLSGKACLPSPGIPQHTSKKETP